MAVAFPLSLVALDVLLKRKYNAKLILEKLPMFLISIAAGILAFKAQIGSGAVASFHSITFLQRIMVASYGFVMHIVKAFVPINLSAYYPYPVMTSLPAMYYLMPSIAALLIALPLYCAYKAGENHFRVVLFGLAFYLVNVVFVLQFISSGPTIMADRYTYVSYLGIFFILIYLVQQFWEKHPSMHVSVQIASAGFLAMLAFLCFNRTKVWHNTETLFKDVIAKYPGRADLAYINLGAYYGAKGDIVNAYKDYKMLADMHNTNPIIYNNLGNIYSQRRQFDSALTAYSTSIRLDSTDFHPYVDRGMTYARERKYELALQDYNHAFRIDSTAEKLLGNRADAYFMTKQYGLAAADYTRAIRINPGKADYYFDRGLSEMDYGDLNSAGADFTHTLSIDPANKDCIFDMSLLYNKVGDYANALTYANKAKEAGYRVSDEYINSLHEKAVK